MTTTLWGEKRAGSEFSVGEDELGGGFVTIGDPDRVRTPRELGALGGVELRVARVYQHECPCRAGHTVKTLAFVDSDLRVSECPASGFMWWKPR